MPVHTHHLSQHCDVFLVNSTRSSLFSDCLADWQGHQVCCGPRFRRFPKSQPCQEPHRCGGYWWQISGWRGKYLYVGWSLIRVRGASVVSQNESRMIGAPPSILNKETLSGMGHPCYGVYVKAVGCNTVYCIFVILFFHHKLCQGSKWKASFSTQPMFV